MDAAAIPVDEFEQEMTSTRRLLARVPDQHGAWKPHQKSFPLGHLAQLVATMPGWIDRTLRERSVDLSAGEGYSLKSTETLLEHFDQHVRKARAALVEVTGVALDADWSLRRGDQVLWTDRRGDVVRNHLSHLVHHRGQLTVYLRLLDVPLPSIYGPTADEGWG